MAIDVLVVEDDADLAEFVRVALAEAGMTVRVVGALAGARRELATRHPNVLLVDVFLPDGQAWLLAHELEAAGTRDTLGIVAFSGAYGLNETAGAWFDVFLRKPQDLQRIVEAVQQLAKAVAERQ